MKKIVKIKLTRCPKTTCFRETEVPVITKCYKDKPDQPEIKLVQCPRCKTVYNIEKNRLDK